MTCSLIRTSAFAAMTLVSVSTARAQELTAESAECVTQLFAASMLFIRLGSNADEKDWQNLSSRYPNDRSAQVLEDFGNAVPKIEKELRAVRNLEKLKDEITSDLTREIRRNYTTDKRDDRAAAIEAVLSEYTKAARTGEVESIIRLIDNALSCSDEFLAE